MGQERRVAMSVEMNSGNIRLTDFKWEIILSKGQEKLKNEQGIQLSILGR
jgi:hypothetical protein